MENKPKIYTIKDILVWVGAIMASLSSIVYVGVVVILVRGFKVTVQSNHLLLFAALGALAGILIITSLYLQGVALAKQQPEAKTQLEEYKKLSGKSKTVKVRSITYYFWLELTKTVILKGINTGLMLYLTISFIVEGIGDEQYITLALANVGLFLGLGLLALNKGYDNYTDSHMVYLDQKIEKLKEEEINGSITKLTRNDDRIERGVQRSNGTRDNKEIVCKEGESSSSDSSNGRLVEQA